MKYTTVLLSFILGLLVFSGCMVTNAGIQGFAGTGVKVNQGHGPPPHAPAHGYRHKYHGHPMTYDTRIGAYMVIDVPETYFCNNLYLRLSTDGRWMVTAQLGNAWRLAVGNEVPEKLKKEKGQSKHAKDKKKKKKEKKY